MLNLKAALAAALFITATSACHIAPTPQSPATPVSYPAPDQAGHDQAGAPPSPAAAAPVAAQGSAECPNPADHCLPEGEQHYWALDKKWERNWSWAELATQTTAPDAAGEAKFFLRRKGSEMSTQFYYTTRPAQPGELAVGQRVVMFHDNRKDEVFLAPRTRTEATGKRWWTARIASIAPVASNGYVLTSGGYKVSTDNLRLVQGDDVPTVVVNGAEDAHFLQDEHWLVSLAPLADGKWQWVELGAAIQKPSPATRNEGHFMMVAHGTEGWTPHAWLTRPAVQADISNGKRVFMFHDNRQKSIFLAPRSRQEGVTKRWWTGVVTDASTAYKGIVTVAGKHQVSIDAIRVAR